MNDIATYVSQMNLAMNDKIEFWGHLDPILIVDFGCANGALFKELVLRKIAPQFMLGYDKSCEMLNLAEHNLYQEIQSKEQSIKFTDNWLEVLKMIRVAKSKKQYHPLNKPTVLNLSSVIHEVYSYCSTEEIVNFWNKFYNSGFDYIVIRDMMLQNDYHSNRSYEEPWIVKSLEKRIKSTIVGDKLLQDYKNHSKSTFELKVDILHFLTKFKFTENWEYELNEHYFRCSIDILLSKITEYGNYNIEYMKSYILPHLKLWVKSELNYDISINTHAKLILKTK